MSKELEQAHETIDVLNNDLNRATELIYRGVALLKEATLEIAVLVAERDLLKSQRDKCMEEISVLNRALIRERELRSETTIH